MAKKSTKHNTNQQPDRIGSFKIVEVLQRTAAGTRFLVRAETDEEQLLLEQVEAVEETADQIAQTFSRLAAIDHPAFTRIRTTGRDENGNPFIAFSFTGGHPLAEDLATIDQASSVRSNLHLGRQIATALYAAHQADVVHPDLRPEHIYLTDDNGVLLLGFGQPVGKRREEIPSKQLDFASPEADAGERLTPRSNIYSLGILLYTLLAEHPPQIMMAEWDIFERSNDVRAIPLKKAAPGLTEATYLLVRNCIWRQAWNRFDSMKEVIAALDAAIAAEEAARTPAKKSISLPSPADRRWWGGGVVLLLLLLIGAFFIFGGGDGDEVEDVTDSAAAVADSDREATDVPATATTAVTPTATITPTFPLEVEVLAPPPETEVGLNDTITFTWRWPVPLVFGQQFIIFVSEDDTTLWQETVYIPAENNQYELDIDVADISETPGTYQWQIMVEDDSLESILFETTPATLTILANTPTPTATLPATDTPVATATPAETSTPTASPTAVCVPNPPPSWITYSITAEDTLFDLATLTGTTTDRLLAVNCLTADSILSVGQTIFIPPLPPTETPTSPPSSGGGSGGSSGGGSGTRPTLTPPPP